MDNIGYIQSLAKKGYQAYTDPRVAELTDQERSGQGMINTLAGTGNQYAEVAGQAGVNAATAGPQSVSTIRAIDNVPGAAGGAAGSTQDYMDPYLAAVLQPQLYDIDMQRINNQKNLDRVATMGGAFGDARSGFEAATNNDMAARLRAGTIGQASSDAFRQALATKSADINRMLDVDKTNAALMEEQLRRALTGGTALTQLDQYNTGRTADLAKLQTQFGAMGRQVDQAKLDAAYMEYAKGNIDQATMLQILNQAVNASPLQKQGTETTTTTAPDNSGYQLIGTLAGSAIGSIGGPVGTAIGGQIGSKIVG